MPALPTDDPHITSADTTPTRPLPPEEYLSAMPPPAEPSWNSRGIQRARACLVALKWMFNAEATGAERARFRTEGEAMARIKHPGIARIYWVDEHEGRPYFVMEYSPGGTLADYLDR